MGTNYIFLFGASQESLIVYINPNPRNLKLATYDGIIKLTELLKKDKKNFNPHAELLSCIQRSAGRKIFLDFDVDTKDFDFAKMKGVVSAFCFHVLEEARGSFHLLVRLLELDPSLQKSF